MLVVGRRVEGMEVVGKVEALVGRLAAVVGSREGWHRVVVVAMAAVARVVAAVAVAARVAAVA